MKYYEWIANAAFVIFLGSLVAAIVLRITRSRRKLRMPPARVWWIPPSILTAAFFGLAIYYSVQDYESSLSWAMLVPFIPLFWGAALTVRLVWHAAKRRL